MVYRMDIAFLGVFLGVSAAILWLSRAFPETGERFGPAFVPCVLALLLAAFSLPLLARWMGAARRQDLGQASVPSGFTLRATLFALMLAAYTLLLSRETPLGFPLLTMLFLLGAGLLFGGRSPVRVGLMAVLTSMGLYLFFRIWLHVSLRPSAWF